MNFKMYATVILIFEHSDKCQELHLSAKYYSAMPTFDSLRVYRNREGQYMDLPIPLAR